MIRAATSYPAATRSAATTSSPRVTSCATFSMMTIAGRSSRTIRAMSNQSPERAPASPSPFPATEMSWQGNPAQMMSTRSSCSDPTLRTSLYLFASGQCFASTPRHHASISTCQSTSPQPAHWRPRSIAPMPVQREPMVGLISPSNSFAIVGAACTRRRNERTDRPRRFDGPPLRRARSRHEMSCGRCRSCSRPPLASDDGRRRGLLRSWDPCRPTPQPRAGIPAREAPRAIRSGRRPFDRGAAPSTPRSHRSGQRRAA